MGLRDRIKTKIKRATDRLSGEYSSEAPEEMIPYDVPGEPQEDVTIVRARLKRPREKRGGSSGSSDS